MKLDTAEVEEGEVLSDTDSGMAGEANKYDKKVWGFLMYLK